MKTLLKIMLWAIGLVVALVLALVLSLPLWLGPVVKPAASAAVPTFTKTSFSLDRLSLNPYTGRFELGGLKLGNPTGYQHPIAVSLDTLVVDVAMATLAEEYIHVEEITVKGLFASYLYGGEYGVDNFTQIQYNLAGGKEKYEAKKAREAAEKKDAKAEPAKSEPAKEAAEEDLSKRKLVIDRLTVGDIKVCLGPVTVPVPVALTLTDIGKKENGVTLSELTAQVWQEILKQTTQLGDSAKLMGAMLGDNAGKLGKAIEKVDVNAATKAVSESAGKLNDAAKAIDVNGATKAVNESADKAVNALKGLFK